MTLHDWMDSLSTGRPRQERERAIFTLANELGDPRLLVMPQEGKSCWRAAAWTLRLMGRPYLDPALPGMLEWIRDRQYPGADVIARTLVETVPKGNLSQLVEQAARKAVEQEDEQWLQNLASLAKEAGLLQGGFLKEEVALLLCFAGVCGD